MQTNQDSAICHTGENSKMFSRTLKYFATHITAQKMKFSIKGFFSKCGQILNVVTFTEEILNGKLHLLCSA